MSSDATALARAVLTSLVRGGIREVVLAPGSRNAATSFHIEAPTRAAASATCGFIVSIEIGALLRARIAAITGTTRAISSSAETGAAPGRVDSPPTSMMSAPASSIARACGVAAPSIQRPPSENESGVTFSTPMT